MDGKVARLKVVQSASNEPAVALNRARAIEITSNKSRFSLAAKATIVGLATAEADATNMELV